MYCGICVAYVCMVYLEGLSLLGAYEDSEEEDAVENQATTIKAKLNQSGDIDSTLANFMAVSKYSLYVYALSRQCLLVVELRNLTILCIDVAYHISLP